MCLPFLTTVFVISIHALCVRCDVKMGPCSLLIRNDGPVVLNVAVEITATILPGCPTDDEQEKLLFLFHNYSNRTTRQQEIHKRSAASSFVYADKAGEKTIGVSVYRLGVLLASSNTTFDVYEYIPGEIFINNTTVGYNGQHFVATGHLTNITLELHLSQRVLSLAEFTYSWNIEDKRRSSTNPYVVHRFESVGRQWIRAAVVARIPPTDVEDSDAGTFYKWGYFERELYIKDPFNYINITGNTYLEHGQLLNLDISCNGSGPVDYCWKILSPENKNQNLTCFDPVSVPECHFPILYYFQDSGEYLLAVHVDNIVSELQRNIHIKIYDVSLHPQLSTVTIPVVCTVLVLFIVAGAVVVHLRRQPLGVETADFDFLQAERGTLVVETTFEHMRASIFQLLRIYYGPPTEVHSIGYGTVLFGHSENQ